VDEQFYLDAFANGTAAGMIHFEQDFLCTHDISTNLTNSDLHTGRPGFMVPKITVHSVVYSTFWIWLGRDWLTAMDRAAQHHNITLQLCMMNPIHTLFSTKMMKVHAMSLGAFCPSLHSMFVQGHQWSSHT
jgi:hypothetical protein